MKSRSRTTLAKMLVIVAVVGAAATASAKTIAGWIQEQSFTLPTGTWFKTCGGDQVVATSTGYDTYNNVVCFVRPRYIGYTITQSTTDCNTAVKYKAGVASAGNVFVTSQNYVAWGGLWTAASVTTKFVPVSAGQAGTCQTMTLTGVARGY